MLRATLRVGTRILEYTGTTKTQVFLLLGHPVGHSLSPILQNAAFRALGLDAVFVTVDVAPPALPQVLADLRVAAAAGRVGGVNVTLPHKQAVLPFVDALDDDARLAGAVNTLVYARAAAATCSGANTDVAGLRCSLDDAGVSMTARPVVVLGAGGMARAAVAAALRARAAEVRVLARDPERAQSLVNVVAAAWPESLPRWVVGSLASPPAGILDDAAVLVQATSLGLDRHDPSPIALVHAPPALFVFEAIYNPSETALLRAARAAGLGGTNGIGMLVHQGARALHLWTGREPPLEVMRRSLGLH